MRYIGIETVCMVFFLNNFIFRIATCQQVANYGLAGQYNVHFDQTMMDKRSLQAREVFNVRNGDRMATIMGYLSDVQVTKTILFCYV